MFYFSAHLLLLSIILQIGFSRLSLANTATTSNSATIKSKSAAFCEFVLESNNLITLDNPVGLTIESDLQSIFNKNNETPFYKKFFSKSASAHADAYVLNYLSQYLGAPPDFIGQIKMVQQRYKAAGAQEKLAMSEQFQRDIRAAKTRIKSDQLSMIKYLNDFAELNSMQNFFFTVKAYQNRISAIRAEVQRLTEIAIVTEDSDLLIFATKLQIDGELFFAQFQKSPLAKVLNPFDFFIYFSNMQPFNFIAFNYYDTVHPSWYSIMQSPFYIMWFQSKENISLLRDLNNPANTNYDNFSQFALNHSIMFYGHMQNVNIEKILVHQLNLLASPLNKKQDMERLFDHLFEVPAINQYLGASIKPRRTEIINQALQLKLNLP